MPMNVSHFGVYQLELTGAGKETMFSDRWVKKHKYRIFCISERIRQAAFRIISSLRGGTSEETAFSDMYVRLNGIKLSN
jgi:hypothetical protein